MPDLRIGTRAAIISCFEYSDAPCLPWDAEHGILAKVGLSEFHHRDGLDVSMPLFSMVTFIHSNRSSDAFRPHKQEIPRHLQTPTKSARSDAMRNHLPKLHNRRDIVLVCACRWFGEARMGREGKVGYDPSCKQAEEEFNKYTCTDLALKTKFGLIIMAAGAIPVIVVDHYVLPYQDLLDWETFSTRIPRAQAPRGVLPIILRSIPDEVVEMMHRRVAFVFEEFFKPTLESARINLFSGDNAWQVALEPAAVTPNHHCSGGMNRRALPCDDHPATLVRLRKQQHQLTPQSKQAMNNVTIAHGSWLPAAGNRWRQHKLHFRLAAAAEAMHTYRQDEGNVEDTSHACQVHSPHTWYVGGRLPEDRWRMMGGAHMMGWEQQLWTHTSMVMGGTSNHSDAVMRSSALTTAITAIAIDRTAAITLRPTPAPIWREADLAHVTRSHQEVSNVVEEAHEAVEPTTMTMTSDAGERPTEMCQQLMAGCILDELALCLSSISCSSSSSLVTNSSDCDHGCGGCDVRRCAVASGDDDDGGGE
ncbi:hypothetical protein PTSG_12361 [Salpingoeca rosetta]|uniref:Exostosin GT47 domain-containing protein n=1 Tax=Salpingoeca rosetta (strain ATCC 50818 / BSB-021) TaxID=946362 RepID=F2UB85_SALR5|nr:uncharacterized protein PTSG_12361 [Salpingoeca rosetta]EGD74098.1 hypothetical protein PTSG_12361 [Salpingoeca rosetta]|eukprot:XP_004993660.1 hypothetical protein PTSG_12361 [Salpingoeca rosetta]